MDLRLSRPIVALWIFLIWGTFPSTDCYQVKMVSARVGDDVSLFCLPGPDVNLWCDHHTTFDSLFEVKWKGRRSKISWKEELDGRSLTLTKFTGKGNLSYKCWVKIYNHLFCCPKHETEPYGPLSSMFYMNFDSKLRYRSKVADHCHNKDAFYTSYKAQFNISIEKENDTEVSLVQQKVAEDRRRWVRSVAYFRNSIEQSTYDDWSPDVSSLRIKHYLDFDRPDLYQRNLQRFNPKAPVPGARPYVWQAIPPPNNQAPNNTPREVLEVVFLQNSRQSFSASCNIGKGIISEGVIKHNEDPRWKFTPYYTYPNHSFSLQQRRWKVDVNLVNMPVGRLECFVGTRNKSHRLLQVDFETHVVDYNECQVTLTRNQSSNAIRKSGKVLLCAEPNYNFLCGRGFLKLISDRTGIVESKLIFKFPVDPYCREVDGKQIPLRWQFIFLQVPTRIVLDMPIRMRLLPDPVPSTTLDTIHSTNGSATGVYHLRTRLPTVSTGGKAPPLHIILPPVLFGVALLALVAWCFSHQCRQTNPRQITINITKVQTAEVAADIAIIDDYIQPVDCYEFRVEVLVDQSQPSTDSTSNHAYLMPVNSQWEVDPKRIVMGPTIGSGQFGTVNCCMIDGTQKVAMKSLKDGASERDLCDLLSELALMQYLGSRPHPHVIGLVGAFTQGPVIAIITEYAENGCLLNYMRTHWDSNRSSEEVKFPQSVFTMLKFSMDIASGMEFLARKKIVHRDLAARNILLDGEGNLLVSDFGLTRWTGDKEYYVMNTQTPLPVKWMAVESLLSGHFSTRSDVWSFGVTVWEIFTAGELPYSAISNQMIRNHVIGGERLTQPSNMPPETYSLLLHVWQEDPWKRPSFSQLAMTLACALEPLEDDRETRRVQKEDVGNHYV